MSEEKPKTIGDAVKIAGEEVPGTFTFKISVENEPRAKNDDHTLYVSPAIYEKLALHALRPLPSVFTKIAPTLNRRQKVRRFFRFKKQKSMKKAHDFLFRHGDYCDYDY